MQAVIKTTALRELFEETGLYFEGQTLKSAPPSLASLPFDSALSQLGSPKPAPSLLLDAGCWVTPPYTGAEIEAHFFVTVIDEPVLSDPLPGGEFDTLGFEAAQDILHGYAHFSTFLAPPTLAQIRLIAEKTQNQQDHGSASVVGPRQLSDGLSSLLGARGEELDAWEILPGIVLVPLKTPTLLPATHTNAYLLGQDRWIVVDPATYSNEEREKLAKAIEEYSLRRGRLEAVVLTHHHPDHVGSATWISERYGVPIRAHPITKALLEGQVTISQTIDEGDRIDLGLDDLGRRFCLSVLFTPGHAPGHIVLVDDRPEARAMVVGDMVAGIGTIVIDPPEGNMTAYLASLDRIAQMGDRCLLPAHGAAIAGGQEKCLSYIAHRLERERRVLGALDSSSWKSLPEIVQLVYHETPTMMLPLATRSCLAHLEKLVSEGRAVSDEQRFMKTQEDQPRD